MKDREERETAKLSLPYSPKQRSGPGHGEKALWAKTTARMDPSPLSLGYFPSTILNVLADKKKLKIDCNFQFSIFRLATDCNIVGKATLPLSFIFLFIVDRIKVKIEVIFQYSINGKKKSKIFDLALSYFL